LEEILAMILSDKGDFDAAAEHLRNYLRISPTAKDADKVRGQLIQIEKLAAAGKESAQPPQ
jgi:thioredoxin-like negative regulator of GroEL